ncbi:ATP-binding protein [Rhodovastum atsumiense]|uniref:Uncharacterized protein n=1 Tax=Rhodovastum atsumiense TaxID=504468 RepID=A0A5M6IUA6_9PROT|nr:hypothetical protein [Rhodovastum atsumiense]KAA5611900.1 hypothetical protein F1189_12780 [Rhodovastum atsumiense]
MQWFEVDRNGLAKILERKGKEFVLYELVQNAWDQQVARVDVRLTKEPGARVAVLRVEDDDPDGFADLRHAWTLFAESGKKGNAEKRGRFNLGEKLVLALCEEAEIVSTKGGVRFDADGRHHLRRCRERGSVFEGRLRLTNAESDACCRAMGRLLAPAGVETTFNGTALRPREPVATFEASLRTEVSDTEGNLRPATRKTVVRVHRPAPGETGTLYEMGIPVVETGDGYHVDVQQKVPLGFEREHVPPGYLRTLRALVLNAVHEQLPKKQATSVWVREALGTSGISADAVRSVIRHRFGRKAVVHDPSDLEANKLAIVKGYTVVHGGQLSGDEWKNVRAAGALLPAGQVTPSPKPFSPGGSPLVLVQEHVWSAGEHSFAALARRVALATIDADIAVKIADDPGWRFDGCYGKRRLIANRAALGRRFFEEGASERVLDFLLHELGHEWAPDHLSEDYHRALTKLGARLALAAAREPGLLEHSGQA